VSVMVFRPRKARGQVHLSVTPLIDVLFLLLIFFMLTGTFKRFGELELTLPASSTAAVVADEAVDAREIVLATDGRLLLDGEPVEVEVLGERLRALREADPEVGVVLKAEAEVAHVRVVELLDRIRDAGYPGVSLGTEVSPGGSVPIPGESPSTDER